MTRQLLCVGGPLDGERHPVFFGRSFRIPLPAGKQAEGARVVDMPSAAGLRTVEYVREQIGPMEILVPYGQALDETLARMHNLYEKYAQAQVATDGLEASMQRAAKLLDLVFNGAAVEEEKRIGFALLVFPFGDWVSSNVQYVSNAERSTVTSGLKELLARWEGGLGQSAGVH